MKTLEELMKQEPVYLRDFKSKLDVVSEFFDIFIQGYWAESDYEPDQKSLKEAKEQIREVLTTSLKGVNLLFSYYCYENYEGDAFVLFEKEGKLYEVNGSHCSCYGLERQWSPEEVMPEELEHRLLEGTFGENWLGENKFKKELCKFLGVEYKTNAEK